MNSGVTRTRELTAMPAMKLVLSPVDDVVPPLPVPTGVLGRREVAFELGKGGRFELDDDGWDPLTKPVSREHANKMYSEHCNNQFTYSSMISRPEKEKFVEFPSASCVICTV